METKLGQILKMALSFTRTNAQKSDLFPINVQIQKTAQPTCHTDFRAEKTKKTMS